MNMDVIQDAPLSRRQLRFSLAFETHVRRQSQVTVRLTTCEIHSNGHLDYGVSYELRSGVSQPSLLPTQDSQMLFARCYIYKWAFCSVRENMYFMYMWQLSEALDKSRHWWLGLVVTLFTRVNIFESSFLYGCKSWLQKSYWTLQPWLPWKNNEVNFTHTDFCDNVPQWQGILLHYMG